MTLSVPDGAVSQAESALLERAITIALGPGRSDAAVRLTQRLTHGEINATRAACLRLLGGRPKRSRDLLRLLDVLDEALDLADAAHLAERRKVDRTTP